MDNDNARRKFSADGVLLRARTNSRDDNRTRNSRRVNYLNHVCFWAIILSPSAAAAQVNATAAPSSVSNGSVTNQAIQMLTGPYPNANFGGSIACQGPTFNLSPFVTKSKSYALPYNPTLTTPIYDTSDVNEDGVPDNPGRVLYLDQRPSNQKDSHALNFGISATISFPLDGGIQERCKAAADTQTALQRQVLANKRLDFELARLKNCGELAQKGISFHPKSQYFVICSDVVLGPVPGQKPIPHVHRLRVSVPASTSAQQGSVPAAKSSVPIPIPVEPFSRGSSK